MDILDVGCGNGWMLQGARRPGRNYDAIDIADLLPDKTGMRFFQESFVDFVPDKKYDLIFARNVFSQEVDPLGQAKRYAQFLKPGGVMCVSFMADDDSWTMRGVPDGGRWHGVSKDQVSEFQKGFEVLWFNEFLGDFKKNASEEIRHWHWYQLIIKNI